MKDKSSFVLESLGSQFLFEFDPLGGSVIQEAAEDANRKVNDLV